LEATIGEDNFHKVLVPEDLLEQYFSDLESGMETRERDEMA
jgi:hypothetical protein